MSRLLVPATLFCTLFVATFAMAQNFQPRQSSEAIGHLGKQSVSVEPSSERADQSQIVQASVAPKSEYVAVMGLVKRPGVYEFRNGISNLERLLRHAGDLMPFASRDFYVIGRDRPLTRIEPSQQRSFQFVDGDILIVETPAHYYSNLNEPGAQQALLELHPNTQIVLVNIAERPILLNLSPWNAHLPAILKQLQQPTEAMVGVDLRLPPNAKLIPPNAQLAPSLILSGSILIFDPARIQQDRLPAPPNAIVTEVPSDLRTVSAERPVPLLTMNSTAQSLIQTHEPKSDWSLPNVDPNDLPAGTAKVNLSDSVNNMSESSSQRDELSQNPLPEITVLADSPATAGAETESSGLLSSRQWKYVMVFCVLIVMFSGAVIVRRHQEGHDYRNLFGLATRGYSAALSTTGAFSAVAPAKPSDVADPEAKQTIGSVPADSKLVAEADFLAAVPQSILDDPMIQAIFPNHTASISRENESLALDLKQSVARASADEPDTVEEICPETEDVVQADADLEYNPLPSLIWEEETASLEQEDADLPRYQPVAEDDEEVASEATEESDEQAELVNSLTIEEPADEVEEEDDFAAGILPESHETTLENVEESYEHDVILPPTEVDGVSSEPAASETNESEQLPTAVPRPKMIDLPQSEEKSLLSRVLRAIERERETNQ